MPYAFTEHPEEPEPQPSSSRGALPPRKLTGTDLLDPPSGMPAGAHSAYKRPHVSFLAGVLLLLGCLAALLVVGFLSR